MLTYLINGVLVSVRISKRNDDPVDAISQCAVLCFFDELFDNVDSNRSGDPFSGVNHGINYDDWLHKVLEAGCRDPHVFDLTTFEAETCVDHGHGLRIFRCQFIQIFVDLKDIYFNTSYIHKSIK